MLKDAKAIGWKHYALAIILVPTLNLCWHGVVDDGLPPDEPNDDPCAPYCMEDR
jgi:hypothetical protein